jgi:hypothetical protein
MILDVLRFPRERTGPSQRYRVATSRRRDDQPAFSSRWLSRVQAAIPPQVQPALARLSPALIARAQQLWQKRALWWVWSVLAGIGVGVAARLLFFLLGALLLAMGAFLAERLLESLPSLDPVYTRALFGSLGGVRPRGVEVWGPVGQALQAVLPQVFVGSGHVGFSLARIALQPGSPILGQMLAVWIAESGVLALGIALIRWGLMHRRPWLTTLAVMAQVQVAVSILTVPPRIDQIDSTGASFAFNAILPHVEGRSGSLTDLAAHLPATLVVVTLVVLALFWAYVGALGLLSLVWLGRWAWRACALGERRVALPWRTLRASASVAFALLLSSALVAGAFPLDEPAPLPLPAPAPPALQPAAAAVAPALDTGAIQTLDAPTPAPVAIGPSVVQVQGSNYNFTYVVNGAPTVIHGMGLNTQYHTQLTPEQRAARLDADFAEMADMGVNTVLGWDQAEFDETLMQTAQARGIGVVLPFDLDPDLDYTDPLVRVDLTQHVLAWVDAYKDDPALRMWGLGNEVLHKIVHPSWIGQQDPAQVKQAQAFAQWLVQVADAIHARDPNHPVTYREAEDSYNSWVLAAEKAEGGGPRTWFVWGANCYTMRVQTIMDNWWRSGTDEPLWISEFAPGGMAGTDRPAGFEQMWSFVRADPHWVLGAAVYAWTRNGPEEIDRSMGISDDGALTDPPLYQTLGNLFRSPS